MTTSALGIDVSKDALDVNIVINGKERRRHFANDSAGWAALLAWLRQNRAERVHACLEATGRFSLGAALALHDSGHVVSVVNPAQIRDFARSRLGRNKTDQIDAAQIRDFATLLTPKPWTPPSPALRRLNELHAMRAGFVASQVEWRNRAGSGLDDAAALSLAQTTIAHFDAQIAAVDRAIAQTIDDDDDLRGKRDLLLSVNGVGKVLAAVLLAQLPGTDVLKTAAQAVAYVGLNPRQHQSGSSVRQPTRISKIGNAKLRTALFMPALAAMRGNPAIVAFVARLRERGRLTGKQLVIAAMRKLLAICFGVLKSGRKFDPAIAMAA